MKFAEWTFFIHSCEEGQKVSRLDNLKQVAKTHKKLGLPPPKGMFGPEMPKEAGNAWDTFTNMSSVNYTEIQAMISLTGNTLEPWEVEAIMGLDKLRRTPSAWGAKDDD